MKNIFRATLYIFILLIMVGGVLLFVFRNSLSGFLEESNGLEVVAPTGKVAADKDTLDLDVMKSANFTSLTKNVVNFDFDNICGRPNIKIAKPAVSSETATGTPEVVEEPLNCAKGNNMPFVPEKK